MTAPSAQGPDASFSPDDSVCEVGPAGQIAHRDHLAQTERLARRLWQPRPGVWCLVGNGLSNQTFVEGPDGLIAIDTGESVQEMAEALDEIRAHTDKPVVAVIYTHFHYVSGTAAIVDGGHGPADLEIWGHERIVANRLRMGSELSAAASRGLVHQFGTLLPGDGPDGLVNVGLGLFFRSPDHAPFTAGFLPPTDTIGDGETVSTTIAGLAVELTPAPSDSDDSITVWFPELSVAVHNILWPALFNVFAIRGEAYRDPRLLLTGLDHLIALGAEHLVCTHGPPMSGADEIVEEATVYRDSIQFMWDQTARGINRGLTLDELISFVQLPAAYDHSFRTAQLYGIVEHHVRQIHTGLRGWFDGDDRALAPMPPAERASRLVAGFGGPDEVRRRADDALAADDLRWALELSGWLVKASAGDDSTADDRDRSRLAAVLRVIGQRTTSANLRNHCLTRALELEGTLDLSRFRVHRFARGEVLANPPAASVHTLRVLLDPAKAEGIDRHIAFRFADGETAGLHVRRSIAAPTDGSDAEGVIVLDIETLADVLGNRTTIDEAVAAGRVELQGDAAAIRSTLAAFDHPAFGDQT